MYTPTFWQKMLPGRPSWRVILPSLALLAGLLGTRPALAQTVQFDDAGITISSKPTGAAAVTTYNFASDAYPSNETPYTNYPLLGTNTVGPGSTPNPNLGTYDLLGPTQLRITGGSLVFHLPTNPSFTYTVKAVRLMYRRFVTGTNVTASTPFDTIRLTYGGIYSPNGGLMYQDTVTKSKTFNLLTSSAGNFTADFQYEVDVTRVQISNSVVTNVKSIYFTDNRYLNYTATVPSNTTTWTGGYSDNWFDYRNWDTGIVPTATRDVIIPNFGSGATNPYPNINSDTTYQAALRAGGTVTANNDTTGPAKCRSLTLSGTSQADRSILRVIRGRLNVYGNFSNIQDSFIARARAVVAFMGNSSQSISNGTFSKVVIDGTGEKSVTGRMDVNEEIIFIKGLLTTNISSPGTSLVVLADRNAVNLQNGAQLVNETDASYLRGFVQTSRGATVLMDDYTYGAMGIGVVWNTTSPGSVIVTRNSAEFYKTSNRYSSTSSIRRIFGIRPTNTNAGSGGLNGDMTVRWLTSERKRLGTSGNLTINAQNLSLFYSNNSGNTFVDLGRTTNDTTTHTLTRTHVSSYATFTLSDYNNPLPVSLVAFDAKRQVDNALITWATATEYNSSGFEVQVATDGKNFRKMAFVPSPSANSTQRQEYRYMDTEAGKLGVRYYRLRQVDLDGNEDYSPVQVVSFADIASTNGLALSMYPNPFNSSQRAAFVLQARAAGTVKLEVMDLMGRTLVSRDLNLDTGVTEVAVPDASNLAVGTYLVRAIFATGEVETLRMQKQ